MRGTRSLAPRPLALLTSMAIAVAVLAAPGAPASAQSPQSPPPVPIWRQSPLQQSQAPPPPPAPAPAPAKRVARAAAAPPAPGVIARVDGRDITQADYDRVGQPYFQRLRSQLGEGFNAELQKAAAFNVLDELIRREILAIESQRQKTEVTQADVDAILKNDPFFQTNGRFDPAKLADYKNNPASNYLVVLPRIREAAAMARLDESLRKRFTPTPAQVRAEFERRTDQVRVSVLPLLTRDLSLEPEAGEAEWAQYYAAHPDQFMRRMRVRLRYARLTLPAEGDSTRAAAEEAARARGSAIADSLRRGTLPDSAAELTDTGLFELPSPVVPGLGRVPELADTLGRAEQDAALRVIGPIATRDGVVVATIVERQPRHLPPLREVIAEVKRRADFEKRRQAGEAEKRAFFDAHRERWRGVRASLTRVTLDPTAMPLKPPTSPEVDRWYAQHGRTLFGAADTSKAWLPPLTDSLRAAARARMLDEQRARRLPDALGRLAAALRGSRDVRAPAQADGAVAETLSLVRFAERDSLFTPAFMESLLASASADRGVVRGPRVFGRHWALWRVDATDTAFVPPYEMVRARADQESAEDRRRRDEDEARLWFAGHREDFKTPVRYGLDVVAVRIPPPDSVSVPETDLRRHYDTHLADFRQEEQVKARHILFMTRDGGPDAERQAKARADSLLAALRRDGGDFAELAKRFSQEPGAASGGGDLGWFGRGRMVKEFEEAAFALQPGQLSPVVKTRFGYHLIKVEDRRPAGTMPFAEARTGIRMQLGQARGDSTARRTAEALRRRLALGGDPQALAAPHGGVAAATPIAATDPLPAVGFVQGLAADLPGLPVGRWAPAVYRAGNHYVVVRLRERVPEAPAAFDEVRPRAVEAMKDAKRRALLDQKVATLRAALAAGASLDSLAAPFGGLRDSGPLSHAGGMIPMVGNEPRLVDRAFAMKPGEVSDTLQVTAGVVWMRLQEKRSGDAAAFQAAASSLEAELTKQRYDAWLEAKKKTMRIVVVRPDLKGPRPSIAGR